MRHALPPPALEALMQAAWQAPLASAVKTPDRLSALVRRPELSTRVAAYSTQLQALPRRVRRALQRQWGLPLATLALWLALGPPPGLSATIAVGGACTLVDALTAANTDRATGGCPAGSGADTIVLPVGSTQTLTEANNDTYGPTGLPVIQSMITIEGQGSTIQRASDAPPFRLVAVHRTGDLTLQATTVSGGASYSYGSGGGGGVLNAGTLILTHSTISGNVAAYEGGGGVRNHGTLTLTHSTISGNYAQGGGGVLSSGTLTVTDSTISGNGAEFGGGVLSSGTLTVTDSTIAGNGAEIAGGVRNHGTCTLTHSTISGNGAVEVGGVDNAGTCTLTDSTISGNGGEFGGGVRNGGTLTVTHSTISGNHSPAQVGGGVFNDGTCTLTDNTLSGNYAQGGGGVRNHGTLTLTHSTLSGNVAAYEGGGVWNGGGVGYAGSLILTRTLISGNTADVGPEIVNESGGTVVADQQNLFGVDGRAGVEGFSPGATDVVPAAGVRLAEILTPTLALHGGRTQTHALVPGSPAIDAGSLVCLDADGAPLLTDQRGQPRVVDGDGDGRAACDIGAFEFFPLVNDVVTLDPDLDTTFDPLPVPGGPAGTFTLTATFTNTSATLLRFPFFEVTGLSGGNLLLNADEGPAGVGATRTPEVGDRLLSPGEAMVVDFVIGLQFQAPFTVFVDLFGEPVP